MIAKIDGRFSMKASENSFDFPTVLNGVAYGFRRKVSTRDYS
jgi:hypothetical protein